MIDNKFLGVASCWDWISPAIAVGGDLVNGDGHTLMIPLECGWTGREIELLLREYGIQTWGAFIPALSTTILITIKPEMVDRAQYVLQQYGIPLENWQDSEYRPMIGEGWMITASQPNTWWECPECGRDLNELIGHEVITCPGCGTVYIME